MVAKVKTLAPPPSRNRTPWFILLAALVVASGLVAWRSINRDLIAERHVPARPSFTEWPPELEARITRAEETARGLLRPASGLAALSRLYHANGFYGEAIQCYDGLQQLEPGEARWPHLQATILAEFGRLDEALPPRERAVRLAGTYLPARLRLGDILIKTNQPAAAAKVYREVLGMESGNPYALLGLARCAISSGDWAAAREHLRRSVATHPGFYGGMTLLVTVNEHFGDQAKADSLRAALGKQEFVDLNDPWLDELFEDCFDAYRLSVAAALAESTGNIPLSRHRLEQAIAIAPASGSYQRQLGNLLAQAGDFNLARAHLEKAVSLSPTDADSWVALFQTMKSLGEAGLAEQTLLAGLSHCPQSPTLHLERARLFNAMGRRTEAIAEFRESDRLRPSEASPLIELAGVLFAEGRSEEALGALHEGLRRQPEHPMVLATLNLYAISIGDETGARNWWSRVRRQTRTPPQVVNTILEAFQRQFGRSLN